MKKLRRLALSLALLPAFANANMLVNGDFEDPSIAYGSWTVLYGNGLTGWTAGAYGIEVRNHVAGNAYSGNQYLELDSYGNSSILQTVSTTAGQNYVLSFAYSPRTGVSAASNPVDVFWNDNLLASITGDGTGNSDNVWQIYSFNVQATGASSTVSFVGSGIQDSLGGSLDAASLDAAVPEPGMLALFGLGLAGFAARRRKRA